MRRSKCGRTRRKLAEVLWRDMGIFVYPEDLWTQEGFYRSGYHDLARWGCLKCWRTDPPEGHPFQISSWNTMTEVARYGADGFDASGYWEITVKPRRTQ